jgi:uncharacterized protein YbaR (Trm112 family)
MSEEQRKKKKKKTQISILETEQIESKLLPELVSALDEAAKEKKYVDIQVCPKCKSPLVFRVDSLGDMWSHIGIAPPNYQCRECGWRQKIVLKATNKPTTVNEVALMADANDTGTERRRKKRFKQKE